jgi:hypothetical protein
MSANALVLGLLAAGVITASGPIAALEPAFGNTIVTTYPNGKTTRMWLHRDGTYDGRRANGQATAGVWKVKQKDVCITQKRPLYVPVAFCTGIVPGGVGTSWTAKGLYGEPVRNTLIAGRQG